MVGSFYAVARGRRTGVFRSWADALAQVKGFSGNQYRKFATLAQAEAYLRQAGVHSRSSVTAVTPHHLAGPFYAVVSGAHPGVFESRDGADRTLAGISCALMRAFDSFADATAYLSLFSLVLDYQATDSSGYRVWCARLDAEQALSTAMLAFCDGSVPYNGRGTAGAVACVFPRHPLLNVDAEDARATTNSRAECAAAMWAIDRANIADPDQRTPLFVFTSSESLVRAMTEYVHEWERNGWRKTRGEPVKNQDLIRTLHGIGGRRRIEWQHVHSEADSGTWQWRWSKIAEGSARVRSGAVMG